MLSTSHVIYISINVCATLSLATDCFQSYVISSLLYKMDELNALDLSQSMAKMEEDHEENLKCKVKELDRCKVREILIQT